MTDKPLEATPLWIQTGHGNSIVEGEGYYLSYNPRIGSGLINVMGMALGIEDRSGDDETALYVESTNKWYILNGDFRKEYERCENLDECLLVYEAHKDNHRSDWSTDKQL